MTARDDDEPAAREALERALAERAAIQDAALPGLSAPDPSARLRAPAPGQHPAAGAKTD